MNESPDIILFLSDDHAAWANGCYGNGQVRTDNIDCLARNGVLMANAFAVTPVCSPARASLMTGRMSSQHGVHDYIGTAMDDDVDRNWLAKETILPQLLHRRGYRSSLAGKWHLGQERVAKQGFDTSCTSGPEYPIYHQGPRQFYRGSYPETKDGVLSRNITDEAIRCLRERDTQAPLFLVIGQYATHSPWKGHPERLAQLFRGKRMMDSLPKEQYPFGILMRESTDPTRLDPEEALCQYYAGVAEIDESVGAVMDELAAQGRLDDSLIVYTSDHGLNCGQHGLWGKGNASYPLNMIERSIRIPMIFHCPNHLMGRQHRTELADHTDLFQTILDFAGVLEDNDERKARNSPGRSLLPLLTNKAAPVAWRNVQFCEYGPVRTARAKRYKLSLYPDPEMNLLFDLDEDPEETHNLYGEPGHGQIQDELSRLIENHFSIYREELFDAAKVDRLPQYNQLAAWQSSVGH
ncbi:MAG: sulfatase-like hydrolase/transferase [Spirochaetota bacterium]